MVIQQEYEEVGLNRKWEGDTLGNFLHLAEK